MRVGSSWERIRALFHAALEQPADARVAFLSSASEGDESLRREVESLLAAHGASDGFLESPAVDLDADDVAARSQLAAGDRFGNFEVIGSLGAGGMGESTARAMRNSAVRLPSSYCLAPWRTIIDASRGSNGNHAFSRR